MPPAGAQKDEARGAIDHDRAEARTECAAIAAQRHAEGRAEPQEDAIRQDHGGAETPGWPADPPIRAEYMKSRQAGNQDALLRLMLPHRRYCVAAGPACDGAAACQALTPR